MLLVSFSIEASNYKEIGLPVTEVYDAYSHAGVSQNWWMVQALDGLIYNGTGIGVNQWDGENWDVFNTPQKTRVRALTIWTDDKIYIGTTNDVGYFAPDQQGVLQFHSLIANWSFDDKQFGETWSVSSNEHGVMFLTSQHLLFWDGKQISKIKNAPGGSHRVFSINDSFYFKTKDDESLYRIDLFPEPLVSATSIKMERDVVIRSLILNAKENITVVTSNNGMFEIVGDSLIQRTRPESMGEEVTVYNAIQASDGFYYLVTLNQGLFVVDSDFKVLKNYTKEHGMATNTMLSVMEDFQGVIWVSGVPDIMKFIPPHIYSHYQTDGDSNRAEIIELVKDKVTLLGDGMYQLQFNEDVLAPAYFKKITTQTLNTWKAVEFDGQLLYAASGGVYALADVNGVGIEQNILRTEFAKSVAVDKQSNTVFATTNEGLFRLNYVEGQWHSQWVENTDAELYYLAIENGVVWAGAATQFLLRVENAQYDDRENVITKFSDKDGLGANNVIPMMLSSGLVIGTNDGVMRYAAHEEKKLKFDTQFPDFFHQKDMDVFRLYEDDMRRLWYRIGTRTGYAFKDNNQQWQVNENVFRSFNDSGYKGFVKTGDNTLWFTLAAGDTYRVDIASLEQPPVQGKLNIRRIIDLDTDDVIFGGTGKAVVSLLKPSNSIRINYALADNVVMNAKTDNMTKYRHRLIGSGKDDYSKWSFESRKDFTSLSGGEYQFELEAKDAWGRVNAVRMSFEVLPVWYWSKTAWFVYGVLILMMMIISAWVSQKWRIKKFQRRQVELEGMVKERTIEIEHQQVLKDRFFTNVSHEFRTPLTLAIAPLEAVLADHPQLVETVKTPILSSLNNSKQMLELIGLVLDVNRLEAGQFPLLASEYDVIELIKNNCEKFHSLAEKNQQQLSVQISESSFLLYFDPIQLDRCLSNLLSNAIKYSGFGSEITVAMVVRKNHAGIVVRDNGKGISKMLENKIFDRFTQGEDATHSSTPGTGIGLSLVRELMALQHGSVELINHSPDGCEFILWLKKGHAHFAQNELMPSSQSVAGIEHAPKKKYQNLSQVEPSDKKDQTTVLVVEDNDELRSFIVSRLSSDYQVLSACNGKEGYDLTVSQLPDLIVSDVMMPVIDGLKMLAMIRQNEQIALTPIVLLTAKSTKKEVVEGLQIGADDYLSKPFDSEELLARVDGLISSRKKIRQSMKIEMSKVVTQLDNKSTFVEKINYYISIHLSDPQFSVETLANEMAVSRFTLNRKCQKECNKSASQLIADTRLQHALNLLKTSEYSVSEIAYGTGYESLTYFSRSFKKQYKKTPSEVRMQL